MNAGIKVNIRFKPSRKFLLLYYTDPFTGREISRSAKTSDHRTAERLAAKWETEIEAGAITKNMSWDAFRQRVNLDYLVGRSQSSRNGYNRAATVFEEAVGSPKFLGMISAEVLSRFVVAMRKAGISDSTAAKHVRHIRALLRWAWKMGFIDRPPAITMPKVTAKSKGRPITQEEFQQMLTAVTTTVPEKHVSQWQDFLRGLWLSGFRLRELMSLSWDSGPVKLNLSGKYPSVEFAAEGQKSRRAETCPISPEFAEFLRDRPRSGKAFPLPIGSYFSVSSQIMEFGRKADILVGSKFASAHDLRRSFATRWALRVAPAVLKSLMRHSSISTTMDYYVSHNVEDISAVLWEARDK